MIPFFWSSLILYATILAVELILVANSTDEILAFVARLFSIILSISFNFIF